MTKDEFYTLIEDFKREHTELEYMKNRLELLKSRRGIKASVQSEVKGNGTGSMENATVDIVDLEEKIKVIKEKHDKKEQVLYQMFNKVKDPTLKYLLIYRYIDCMDWEDVASNINYSLKHTAHRLKTKAIDEVLKNN